MFSGFSIRTSLSILLVGSLALSVFAGPAPAQRGFWVLHANLGQLVDYSNIIIEGVVLSAHAETHPELTGLHTVVITIQVTNTLKGEPMEEFTFRQYLPDVRDHGTTVGYKPGQEVLLFLNKPSEYGFSSPTGMEQGRFLITTDRQGNRVAVNGLNNLGLFLKVEKTHPELSQRLQPQTRQVVAANAGGPIGLEQLKEVIQAEVSARAQR